ncbi:MAG: dimethyladenosine transferase [Paenibacillaceae bacterium]|jgi:16S rRNA (adenine1518-N6/adenine1519-N6)-dimethyltransferase|nr:dimethyladenosine transferase [Paenibacillaceae bacterium]
MKTKEVLNRFSITAKKSLGQNFLTDTRILQRIVDAAQLSGDDGALEIGPGLGALTEYLAQTAGNVVAVEIDQRLLPVLGATLKEYSNVHIVHGDVLKLDLEALWQQHFRPDQQVSVAANLPYYITTPIIMKLLESRVRLNNIVVMVQKEVADRLAARPGGKQYGSLSIAVQYYCEPEMVCIVPRAAFIPQPNVDSAVIRLRVREEPPVRPMDERHFFAVIQASFAQRRKTILNNLLHSPLCAGIDRPTLEAMLQQTGIEPSRRGETLSIEEYARLSDTLLHIAKK